MGTGDLIRKIDKIFSTCESHTCQVRIETAGAGTVSITRYGFSKKDQKEEFESGDFDEILRGLKENAKYSVKTGIGSNGVRSIWLERQ